MSSYKNNRGRKKPGPVNFFCTVPNAAVVIVPEYPVPDHSFFDIVTIIIGTILVYSSCSA